MAVVQSKKGDALQQMKLRHIDTDARLGKRVERPSNQCERIGYPARVFTPVCQYRSVMPEKRSDGRRPGIFGLPEMKNMDMPFDAKRMIFGGFEVMFDTAPIKG